MELRLVREKYLSNHLIHLVASHLIQYRARAHAPETSRAMRSQVPFSRKRANTSTSSCRFASRFPSPMLKQQAYTQITPVISTRLDKFDGRPHFRAPRETDADVFFKHFHHTPAVRRPEWAKSAAVKRCSRSSAKGSLLPVMILWS